jgi:anti-anti-sigma factor
MKLTLERGQGVTVVYAAGEIDLAERTELHDFLAPLDGDVVLDLAAVTYLDSSGLAAIVETEHRLDGRLRLRDPQQTVLRVLSITGLDEWVEGAGVPRRDS